MSQGSSRYTHYSFVSACEVYRVLCRFCIIYVDTYILVLRIWIVHVGIWNVYLHIGNRKQSAHSNPGLELLFLQDITVLKEMKFATRMLYYIWGEISPESFLEISIYLHLSTLAVFSLAQRARTFKGKIGCCWTHILSFCQDSHSLFYVNGIRWPLLVFPPTPQSLRAWLFKPRCKNWPHLEGVHTSFLLHASCLCYQWCVAFLSASSLNGGLL